MNQYPQCQIHQFSPLQFIDISQQKCLWICGSCYHNLEDKTNSKIIDLFQLKYNPLLLKDIFYENFKDFNEMFDILKDIEIYHKTQIGIMNNLIQILNQMILDINKQQEKFKNLIQDIAQKFSIVVNVEKLNELINSIWNQQTNFSEDVKQQFEMQFYDYLMKIQNKPTNFQKERQQIFQFYDEKKLSEPLVEFENQLNTIKKNIKQVDILAYRQILLEKDFKFWTFNEVSKKVNKIINQTNLIYKGEDIKQLQNILFQKTQVQKNLLMIFQSKKYQNLVFGAYTPYECKDDYQFKIENNTSFLFQYNKKISFPIKVQRAKDNQQLTCGVKIFSEAGVRIFLDYRNEQCSYPTAESGTFGDYFWVYEIIFN